MLGESPLSHVFVEGKFFNSLFLCSRLTLGLMGLDELHLRVLATSSDDPVERRNASKGSIHTPSLSCYTRLKLL